MTVGNFFGGIMGEVKQHPYTSIAALLALSGVMLFTPVYLDAAETAQRIEALEETVKTGQVLDSLNNIEGRIKALERDIFDLEIKIREIDRPDEFLNRQLAIWQGDLSQLQARRAALLQRYPELASVR